MRFNLLKNKEKTLDNTDFEITKFNKRLREKSRGRSMVEMLGVLAIIGVLSIGGIAGYTIAMRRYRANEIANKIVKYAMIAYTGFQNYSQNNEIFINTQSSGYSQYMYYDNLSRKNVCTTFDKCGVLRFEDSGLGGLPDGIYSILLTKIHPRVDKDGKTTYYDNLGIPAGEYVSLSIRFKPGETELCKATFSVLSEYVDLTNVNDTTNSNICSGSKLSFYKSIRVD